MLEAKPQTFVGCMNQKEIVRRQVLGVINVGLLGVLSTNLPARWTKPVVDTVLLPAHAQTSCSLVGNWLLKDTSPGKNDAGAYLALNANGIGIYNGSESVTWSNASGTTAIVTIAFGASTAQLNGDMSSDCNSMSGSWSNGVTGSVGTWSASRNSKRQALASRLSTQKAFR